MAELFVSRAEDISKTVEKVFLKATNNLSWLKKGDTVLLKPAVNSPDPYPSTTHPGTVHTIGKILEKRGAKVIIGDMPGMRYLILDEEGLKKHSAKEIFGMTGLSKNTNLKFVGFEEKGWKDFYKFNKGTDSWKDGFWVTNWIKRVDHIINLPRLSTHSQAGVTLGFKNLVGIIRDDSRYEFHADGPYNNIIKLFTMGSKLRKQGKGQNNFWEKITEIYLAVKNKMRLTLITATEAQVTFGPDRYTFSTKMDFLSRSHAVKLQEPLVFASTNPVAVDAFGIALLGYLYPSAPWYRKLLQKILVKTNCNINEPGKGSVWENRFLKHALKLGIGSKNFKINYDNVPEELQKKMNSLIKD